jgi:hypothetical protein
LDFHRADCPPGGCRLTSSDWAHVDGDVTTGVLAHELGHSFGLPHTPVNEPQHARSIMAEHWHSPDNGFTGAEQAALRTNGILTGL